MPASYTFSGRVVVFDSSKPQKDLRIDLFDATGNYGWLGGGKTDPNGYFHILLPASTGALITSLAISVQARIFKGDTSVYEHTLESVTESNIIVIPQSAFDNSVEDETHKQSSEPNYFLLRGRVISKNGIPLPAMVRVFEDGFRASNLIASAQTNAKGEYELKIASREVTHTAVTAERMLRINASLSNGATDSIKLVAKDALTVHDFTFENIEGINVSAFTVITNAIQEITGSAAISGITIEGLGNESDYLATATGYPVGSIRQVINAHKYAQGTTVDPKFFYALIQTRQGFDLSGLTGSTKSEITSSLHEAIAQAFIETTSETEINSAADAILSLSVSLIKSGGISAEGLHFGTALTTVFGSETLVDNYLHAAADFSGTSRQQFWTNFESAHPGTSAKLKKGFQLLAITGFQPEMAAYLLSATGTANNIHELATKSVADWTTIINTVSASAGKTTVPKAVVSASGTVQDIPTYAAKLKDISQRLYPFTAINAKLQGAEGGDLIQDAEIRGQVSQFITDNPKFDLRFVSIHDIDSDDYNISGISDLEGVKEALAPFQRVSRLVGGKPEAVASLVSSGLGSALQISGRSEDSFINEFSEVLGGAGNAKIAYASANSVHAASMNVYQDLTASNNDTLSESPVWPDGPFIDPGSATPDLATLFGSQEQCNCEYCMSVYSPAAYYVDIMHFVQGLESSARAFNELIRRRPDLPYIDLTCKNSNTPVPYVDLVNELLEIIVLKELTTTTPPLSTAIVPASFQTSGKAADLAARPEHIIRVNPSGAPNYYAEYPDYADVYDKALSKAKYPDNLPFNLALEESRVYLKHLGVSRYELMKLYRPLLLTGIPATGNTLYNRYNEYLGISKEAGDIIIDTTGVKTWIYYGFERLANPTTGSVTGYHSPADSTVLLAGAWYDILMGKISGGGIDVVIQQLRISYKELLQLLTTRFLNPKNSTTGLRGIAIAAKAAPVSPDTCVLKDLELSTTLNTAQIQSFFSRLHRFVRLWRASGLDIYGVDKLLIAIGATDIDSPSYGYFVFAKILADRIGVTTDHVSSWMAGIDTERYIDFNSERQDVLPSFYDRLFRNKSVLNPPDPAFSNFSGTQPTFSVTYQDHTAAIAAAVGVTESELIALLGTLQISLSATVSLSDLSILVGLGSFAKGHGWSIPDFVLFITVAGIGVLGFLPPSGPSVLGFLQEDFIDRANAIRASQFSLKEMHYLLQNVDEDKAFIPKEQNIQLFYEHIRNELKKIVSTTNTQNQPDALKNAVVQQFSTQFNVGADISKYLLGDLLEITTISPVSTVKLLDALLDPNFIGSTYDLTYDNVTNTSSLSPLPNWQLEELYNAYYLIAKIAFLVIRLRISKKELKVLQDYHIGGQLNLFDLRSMPVKAGDPLLYSMFLVRYSQWFSVRERLRMDESEFVRLASGLFVTSGALSFTDWKMLMADIGGWDYDDLQEVVGYNVAINPNTPIGTISIRFPADFIYPEVFTAIADIMDANKRIGLSAGQLIPILKSNLVLDDAHKVMKVARARQTDDAWLKIAKPLHDVLREKQRQALVSYVLANPLPGEHWRNENELFAYLLIDVEMKPCMMTSRIKQAISTVQLFVDRLVMNLEYFSGGGIGKEQIKEWKTWRKWYRIWEANRKIFIYPENWIEPELRDNKTPFFKELETQLLQDEIKVEKVEDAYYEYLEKTDEVARLEPVTSYRESEPELGIDIVHLVARTYSEPRHYYYRKLENNEWTAWERMNLEIKSDHVTLVVWNRRLHIYWLTFVEKASTNDEVIRLKSDLNGGISWTGKDDWWVNHIQDALKTDDTTQDRFKYYNVLLNWSELKEDKWLAPKVSNDPMELRTYKVQINFRNKYMYGYWGVSANDQSKFFQYLSKNQQLQIHEVFKNRLYLLPAFDGDGALVLSICFGGAACEEYHESMHAFICDDSSAEPRVFRDGDRRYQFLAPNNTLTNKMKFEEWESIFPAYNNYRNSGTLDTIGYGWIPDWGGYYIYNWWARYNAGIGNMPIHSSDQSILYNTPYPPFRVTARADMNIGTWEINPMENDFSYEDKRNNFFVRKAEVPADVEISFGGWDVFENMTFEDSAAAYDNDYAVPITDSADSDSPISWVGWPTTWKYYFQTFFHPHIHQFIKALNKDGISGVLSIGMQDIADTMYFQGNYQPSWLVANTTTYPYPTNIVEFKFDGAYSQYNWEIFFHIPMLVAGSLSTNQQFEDAQKWYHYIFDPTSNTDDNGIFSTSKARFWKFRPFYEQTIGSTTAASFFTAYAQQIRTWQANPFQPHVIARMRILAYMKNVVMKYIDNLIAWGDQLFRRNTIESINEAIQLYIMAANILGPRPQQVNARATHAFDNYNDLVATGTLDDFSNALVKIETFFEPNAFPGTTGTTSATSILKMQYFCIAGNEKLLAYWDTVADRLFKIRNCMNIEGIKQELPLFEPPIDPALLVRAAAAGVDINSVLDTVSHANTPAYRFSYVIQKANELISDTKSLGGAILSALEKKDAEQLALLRSSQEIALLDKVTYIKQSQLEEAKVALDGLLKTKENTQQRYQYYSSRPFMNANEQRHLVSIQLGAVLQSQQSMNEAYAAGLSMIPQFHGQLLTAVGASFGGQQLSTAMRAVSSIMGIQGIINNARGSMAATTGGYERRRDDWNFQADTAKKELEQIDKQIIGAHIRINIAERELDNHLRQMDNSRQVDEYMRSKFTNKDLYNWMISQIAAVYFQTYQLAYDLAAKAELCYKQELPRADARIPAGGFIKFGYWDSLRKGLLSGEKLQFDLRKMEHSYMEESKRSLELTKHISLALTDPSALLTLKSTGTCQFDITETLFDLDYLGHHYRTIKSVSISIPCVAGPYTTIAAELTLGTSNLNKFSGGTYAAVRSSNIVEQIATSGAQNDNGVFELNFRDERYLPFEGRGIESHWTLAMMQQQLLRQFDYSTISDVILHVRYTAVEDGTKASTRETDLLSFLTAGSNNLPLPRYFSLNHEFSEEWFAYSTTPSSNAVLDVVLTHDYFPFYAAQRTIKLLSAEFQFKVKPGITGTYHVEVKDDSNNAYTVTGSTATLTPTTIGTASNTTQHLKITIKDNSNTIVDINTVLDDIYMIVHYTF